MSAAPSLLTGRRLGSYVLLEPIGSGGMGEVYRARHELLGRIAAIKVLHDNLAKDRALVQRFFNEARAASRVRHAGMVEVYDFGHLDGDCAFLVMEFLEGETLRARLRREPQLPIPVVVDYVRQLTSILEAAHGAGIIHRDLKPENIFIVSDPLIASGERLKLLDFGIAKLADVEGIPSVTQTGDVMGTPTYMSPEQCRGTGNYDGTTDLYALGCIIFEMLAGRPPFVSKFIGDYYVAHIGAVPPLVTEFRDDVPDALVGMIRRLLEKEPSDRIRSAGRLQSAVESLDDDDVTSFDAVPLMTGHGALAAETQLPPEPSPEEISFAQGATMTPSALYRAGEAILVAERPVTAQASTVPARPVSGGRVGFEGRPARRRLAWLAAVAICGLVALGSYVALRDQGPGPAPARASESHEPVEVVAPVVEDDTETKPSGDGDQDVATTTEPAPASDPPEARAKPPETGEVEEPAAEGTAAQQEPEPGAGTEKTIDRHKNAAAVKTRSNRRRRHRAETKKPTKKVETPPVNENVTVNPFGAK